MAAMVARVGGDAHFGVMCKLRTLRTKPMRRKAQAMRIWKHRPQRWRATATAGAILATAALSLTFAPIALAKEYNIAGTVALWTEDISGSPQRVIVDVSWIRKQLPGLDQDEPIDLEVMDRPEAMGGIQALGVTGEGSFVNRLNWGVREEYTTCNDSIRARVGQARDDDEAIATKGIKRCKDLRPKED